MRVTLYQPGQPSEDIAPNGFSVDKDSGQVVQDAVRASELLGCMPALVDVLACGEGYLMYSVFDYEGAQNHAAMSVLAEISGIGSDAGDDDEVLRGPVLVILS
ncbi:hypothetical protein Q5H92_20120 [Hymenobacter sp. M29]|uniref:DUF4242 domain-containing protein n=1 Tax=Hymenobacter mellowenesis TaxID=3063995 RepID=A0ABT9AFP0_9BACT|nr:hypothetical protein [Hymenobacter sp. M29]MDO7848683.1 hypothetical protein [Hymenobacter sp. M29]